MTKLIIRNLSKQFYALKAVNNVSLELEGNNIYGLIGPNGSGKTTLFNCISGVYAPESGEIIFNNKAIQGKSPQYIARLGIRRTFQTIRLSKDMSVAENIYSGYYTQSQQNIFHALLHLGRYRQDEKKGWQAVYRWAEKLQLTHVIDSPVASLPYGLQRKVEIARAMIANPQILVLDEPAAGMNETEKLELTQIINNLLHHNLTILMIEHDMHMITTMCKKIFVLNQGQLIAAGNAAEIQNDPKVIQAYMGIDYV